MTKRPFFYLVISFASGLVCGYFMDNPLLAFSLLLILILLFLTILFLSFKRPDLKDIICIVLVSGFGFFYYEGRTRIHPDNHISHLTPLKRNLSIIGDVISLPDRKEEMSHYVIEARYLLDSKDTIPLCGKVRITARDEVDYGDRLILYGAFYPPPSPSNPGGFDYGSWLERQDIYAVMYPDSLLRLGGNYGNAVVKFAERVRSYIEGVIDHYLGGNQGGFLKGILIGERENIPFEIQEIFRNTGVVHVLAVSGLHVGIIAFILVLLFRLARLPNYANLILTLAFLIIYALMIDLRPSVVRASIMSVLLMVAFLSERNTDMLNSLSFAAFAILLWNPQALFDPGFQLSIGATAGIIYFYPMLHPLLELKRKRVLDRVFVRPFTTSLSAQAGTVLLSAHYFYRLPVISLIANLLVIPLTGLCILTGLFLSFVNIFGLEVLNKICASAVYGFTTITLKVVELFSRVPYGHFWIGSPPPVYIALYFVILLSGISVIYNLKKRGFFDVSLKIFIYSLFLFLTVMLSAQLYKQFRPEIRVTFLDAGHGNSTLLEMGENIVIDGGPYQKGTPPVADLLHKRGVRTISLIFLTSPLYYDVAGLSYLLENFEVRGVALPFIPYHSSIYRKFLVRIKEKRIPFLFVERGDRIGFFTVINPESGRGSREDIKEASLVLSLDPRINFSMRGNCRILFLGHVDNNICQIVRKSEILKAPYFGGYRHPAFLETVKPEVTVVSVGDNRWGLPSEEMLNKYERYGSVLRTDEQGACIVRINNYGFSTNTMSYKESIKQRIIRWVGII